MGRAAIALFIVSFFVVFIAFWTGVAGCWRRSPANITSTAILMLLASKLRNWTESHFNLCDMPQHAVWENAGVQLTLGDKSERDRLVNVELSKDTHFNKLFLLSA